MVRVGGGSKLNDARFQRDAVMVVIGAFVAAILLRSLDVSGKQTAESLKSMALLDGVPKQSPPAPVGRSSGALESSTPMSASEGWHPINVFYGKMNHIFDLIPGDKYWVPGDGKPQGKRNWFSQHGQDVAVFKALGMPKDGFFIDLAANDAVWASNTFVLEQHFGWKGICIEPNPQYWYRLAFRKCHALGTIVGFQDFEEVSVMLGDAHHGPYSGIVGGEFDNKRAKKAEKRYTAGLRSILKSLNAPTMIDYLSLDVEGAETFIMRGFPFDEYKFKCLTIERPKPELQELLAKHGYKKVMDIKRGDTLWAHESIYESAKQNVAKYPIEIDKRNIANWPPHLANMAG